MQAVCPYVHQRLQHRVLGYMPVTLGSLAILEERYHYTQQEHQMFTAPSDPGAPFATSMWEATCNCGQSGYC